VGPPSDVQRHPDVIRAYLGQEHASAAPDPQRSTEPA